MDNHHLMRPIYISRRRPANHFSDVPPENNSDHIFSPMDTEEMELPVDIARHGDHQIIWAPMVGAKNEDISITVNNDILFIHKNNYFPEGTVDNYYVRECHFGPIAREVQLPMTVDPTEAKASLADGVLKIILPIISNRQTRIIKIR